MDLDLRFQVINKALDRQVGEAKLLANQAKALKQDIVNLQLLSESCEKVSILFRSLADTKQQHCQNQIESLVTQGLRTIFSEDMSFHIISETKRGNAHVEFVVRSAVDGEIVETPVLGARGGGVAVVVGFLLRLVVLLLTPSSRRLMLLDESFAQLSEDYEPRLAEFLAELVKKTDLQILMVTHSNAYSDLADQVYTFKLKDGLTTVR